MKVNFKTSALHMNKLSMMTMALARDRAVDDLSYVEKEVDKLVYEFTLFVDSELEKRKKKLLNKNKKTNFPNCTFSISKRFEWGSGISVRLTSHVCFDYAAFRASGDLVNPICTMVVKLTLVGGSRLFSKTVPKCVDDFSKNEVEKMIGESR